MKKFALLPIVLLLLAGNAPVQPNARAGEPNAVDPAADYAPQELYPPADKLLPSPGGAVYYVDPGKGNDSHSGKTREQAWKTLRPVNARRLAPGDRVEIAPGAFRETLMPRGAGTAERPIEIRFAPGDYDFHPDDALKLKLHISNTNDDPGHPKAIAWCFRDIRHLVVKGEKTNIYVHGKMIETMFDRAEDVTLEGLAFDYRRPTVSEFTVLDVAGDRADVHVHPDSKYAVENGKLVWIGEGWRSTGMGLTQELNPADDNRVWRRGSPLGGVTKVEELAPRKLRLEFQKNPGFVKGRVFQFRETFRDCSGGLVNRSKNISWKNCAYHFMHGLGIVSQFSENLTFDHCDIAPRPGSGRTCAGWADLLHFSGCRGQIAVRGCRLSGTNDDPINVHGTHLRIVGKPGENQILVRFMHPQTYGFAAFAAGDEIDFVSHVSLSPYAGGVVKAVEMKNDKEMLLTLENPPPKEVAENDVVENVTWTPSVEVRDCTVSADSCRGFLLTTRRPIVIENNTFTKTTMSAILIADDANSWFESGMVRDVTIRGNRFLKCAEPVINIAPENHTAKPDEPVHENVRIENNYFDLLGGAAISAKSVRGLTIIGNRFSSKTLPVHQTACTDVEVKDNKLEAKE